MAMTRIILDAPHFYAALALRDGHVVRAPPILRYMHNWSRLEVLSYAIRKRWRVVRDGVPWR